MMCTRETHLRTQKWMSPLSIMDALWKIYYISTEF